MKRTRLAVNQNFLTRRRASRTALHARPAEKTNYLSARRARSGIPNIDYMSIKICAIITTYSKLVPSAEYIAWYSVVYAIFGAKGQHANVMLASACVALVELYFD